MATAVERRRAPRIPTFLPVRSSRSREVFGVTRDVSSGGLYIYTESEEWKQGSRIELVFEAPAEIVLDSPTVFCRGTVLRAERVESVRGLAVRLEQVSLLDS